MKDNPPETPATSSGQWNRAVLLTVMSLISGILFMVHLADDIARGIEPGDLNDLVGGTLISFVWLYGTLVLRGRFLSYVIMLIGGIFANLVSYSHMRGTGIGEIARSDGGFVFALTLFLLALTGVFSVALSVQYLWGRLRAG